MKKKATIYDLWKMCKSFGNGCFGCPLNNFGCSIDNNTTSEDIDKINDIIINWNKDEYYILDICPKILLGNDHCTIYCKESRCKECKNEYWNEKIPKLVFDKLNKNKKI